MIRRWVHDHARQAHADWIEARAAYHALTGTPSEWEARLYLERTARRYNRWDTLAALVGVSR